ncbi:MAG: heparinase II/III family protein [Paenibacillaceae bacterium]|nr:heparinase II/III family protein [Paenibacillaceae bacterium]
MNPMLSTLSLRQLKTALEQAKLERYELFEEAASAERWKQIRKDGRYEAFWNGLEEQADRLLASPAVPPSFSDFLLFGDTGDRKKYQDQHTRLFSGLHVFGLLSMTDDRQEWRQGLENAIWSICNEYTWVFPAHVGLYVNEYPNGIWDRPVPPRETVDLYAAVASFALAEVIHRLGDRLHPWVVVRAKAEIERRILQVYFNDPVPQDWEKKTNNWPAVCASCIGAMAIYLTEDSEKLSGMLWRVIGVLRQYLSGFDEQGATPEGPAYWQLGFSNLVFFAELLKERTGGRITLLDEPKIERIAQFPQFCLLTGGKVVNFSDSFDELRFHTGLIHRLRRYFSTIQLPPEQYRMIQIPASWTDATRQMFWSEDSNAEDGHKAALEERVQERIFAGNHWVISKVRQPDRRLAAFAAKGGYNEEPHNHNDLGHFIVHVDGTTVLADIGLGVYTKQYFQPEYRYKSIQAGSHGHSVPIVDGYTQGFGRKYRAQLLRSEAMEDEVLFELDLSEAYECPSLKRLTREFVWRRPAHESCQLVLTDKAEFHYAPASYQEVFVCGVKPERTGEGKTAIGSVELLFDPNEWDTEVDEQLSVSDSRDDQIFYRLILTRRTLSAVFECRFRFEIPFLGTELTT